MDQSVVIVTGAAGAAGCAVCQVLKQAGYRIGGIDRAPTMPLPVDIDHYVGGVDLTCAEEAEKAVQEIALKGELCAVINIAGGFIWKFVEQSTSSDWDNQWAINLKTCLNTTLAALPRIKPGGSIVNISAAASQRSGAGMAPYTAAKSSVSRLTESLAEELKPRRIRVNALLPTILDTPTNRSEMPDADPSLWIRPDELANIISFLISPASSAINGALIPVSGRL